MALIQRAYKIKSEATALTPGCLLEFVANKQLADGDR